MLLFLLGNFLTLPAQQGLNEISQALATGNAAGLSRHFHASIDLTIQDREGTYSRAQAQQIVQDFFNHQRPSAFNVSHVGQSADGSNYVIGHLTTSRQTFRVYMLFKTLGGKEGIQTLRFDLNE